METVLVIGATSDIGFAIAKKFAALKCHLFLTARNHSSLEQLANNLHGITPAVEIFAA